MLQVIDLVKCIQSKDVNSSMGCHTWFSRPITEDEFGLMKEFAPTEMRNLLIDVEESMRDESLYNLLMKSYTENVPCVCGKYWWQLGWGASNPNLLYGDDNFFYEVKRDSKLHVCIKEYSDTFRINNYPSKVIHNRRELRKFLRKKYFELKDWQLEKVSDFFRKYPGGVITFG